MDKDFWQSLARRFVTLAAGALVMHGWVDSKSVTQQDIEMGVSLLMFVGTTFWTHLHQKKMKGTNESKITD